MSDIFSGLADVILGAFGSSEEIIYQPKAGAARLVSGIYDSSFRVVSDGPDGVPVESMAKSVTVKTTDVPEAAHGDRVLVGSAGYTVRGVAPAGGLVTLILGA